MRSVRPGWAGPKRPRSPGHTVPPSSPVSRRIGGFRPAGGLLQPDEGLTLGDRLAVTDQDAGDPGVDGGLNLDGHPALLDQGYRLAGRNPLGAVVELDR